MEPMIRSLVAKTLAVALVATLLLPVLSVQADIAPPPPPQGADIQPGVETTQVRMVAETVIIEVARNVYGESASARVNATFTMRNLGSTAENMQVRFPLNSLFPQYQPDLNTCVYPYSFPEISDFTAQVNGEPVLVKNILQHIEDDFHGGGAKDVACWANFPVTFPSHQDVIIDVRYSVLGYYGYKTGSIVEFPYVLLTGAAWKGTIGSADIILRAPFNLNQENLVSVFPQDGQVQGNEVRWRLEDSEPTSNVYAAIMDPGLWQRIQTEKANVVKNSEDGEAWGRLGRWYKEAIMMDRGFRWDDAVLDMYHQSKEAYQTAVTLKPNDADWHAGFAQLLCWNAEWQQIGTQADIRDDLVNCANQVRLALALNPGQSIAVGLLEELRQWHTWGVVNDPLIGPSNGEPVYLILTQTPTARLEFTATPQDTLTPVPVLPATATMEATSTPKTAATLLPATTRAISTVTPDIVSGTVANSVPTAALPGAAKGDRGGICGIGFLPGAAAVLWTVTRRRSVKEFPFPAEPPGAKQPKKESRKAQGS
ncbi:MAG: hypothetical protein VB089_12830 [Anaerolineaceae bacterium]|nr:hypothetical protein [Anaerolineaceae bacterium]